MSANLDEEKITKSSIKNIRMTNKSRKELNAPKGEPLLEWMLVTNLPITTIEGAIEITKWYALRFRIETFHRILKSGFLVESCRLGSSQAIANYVSLISVAAWKIFWVTMIGRIHPGH